MPLPITTSFCLVDLAVCLMSLPDNADCDRRGQECVRGFEDDVTTTAPSLPNKLAQAEAWNGPCAFALNGVSSRRTAVIVDWSTASNRHAKAQSLRNARNSGKSGP